MKVGIAKPEFNELEYGGPTRAKPEFHELEYNGHPRAMKPEPYLRLGSSSIVNLH